MHRYIAVVSDISPSWAQSFERVRPSELITFLSRFGAVYLSFNHFLLAWFVTMHAAYFSLLFYRLINKLKMLLRELILSVVEWVLFSAL